MSKLNLKRKHRNDEFDNIDLFEESMEGKRFEEPEKWTMITALDRVLDQARRSELSESFCGGIRGCMSISKK